MRVARVVVVLFWFCWACVAQAETPVERGRYIVEVIGACGNCHTPQGPDGRVQGPPMPFMLYRQISYQDVAAIVAYLRPLPPK